MSGAIRAAEVVADEQKQPNESSTFPDDCSSLEDGNAQDPSLEAALVRKLDFHIIPVVMLLYLCSFLDRINIGNAKLYGLEEDLGITGTLKYQTAVSLLFVTYLLFEVPSNLVIKRFRPSRWSRFQIDIPYILCTCAYELTNLLKYSCIYYHRVGPSCNIHRTNAVIRWTHRLPASPWLI